MISVRAGKQRSTSSSPKTVYGGTSSSAAMRRRRPISSLARPESADGAGRGAAGAAESASEGRRMAASSAASSAASACSSSVADGVESRRTPSGPSAYLRRTAQHSHTHVAAAAPSVGPVTRHKARPSAGVMHAHAFVRVCAGLSASADHKQAGGHGRLRPCSFACSGSQGRDGTGWDGTSAPRTARASSSSASASPDVPAPPTDVRFPEGRCRSVQREANSAASPRHCAQCMQGVSLRPGGGGPHGDAPYCDVGAFRFRDSHLG